VLSDRLRVMSFRGTQEFRFAELEYIQPVTFLPPKWLIAASFLAVFLGRSAASTAGQAGRAMLLASSEAGGLYLKARDGRTAYLWFTDQMGNVAVQHLDRLADALEASKVSVKEETQTRRGILPPLR
jgi:predicted deacetylase